MINHKLISFSPVQIYDLSYIYLYSTYYFTKNRNKKGTDLKGTIFLKYRISKQKYSTPDFRQKTRGFESSVQGLLFVQPRCHSLFDKTVTARIILVPTASSEYPRQIALEQLVLHQEPNVLSRVAIGCRMQKI